MKAAAEVKPSVRCSGKPVVGDGSICAVSITKRAKLEEPEAADGITRRSPKLVAPYGAGIAIKRAREPEKPSNKDKGAGEKSKRSNKEERIEEMLMSIDKTVSMVEEKVAEMAGGSMKKEKKVVTWRLSKELLDYLRTKEVMGLLATEAPLPPWANKMGGALFESNQRLKEQIAAEFQKNREFDAHVLYQYRTYGYAEIKEEVYDEEGDVEVYDEEP